MQLEDVHVHEVYESIAEHFSNTRYKPWPRVHEFLTSRPFGSVGGDFGTGNGKYLSYPHVYMIGSDRSLELTKIAWDKTKNTKNDAFRGDSISIPMRKGLDFAISIAVIHHFGTDERRVEAIRSILHTLKPEGECLIYVWALEQKSSRRGWDKGMDQDVMVPWVDNHDPTRVLQRYYHLFKQGELEANIIAAGGSVVESGYERDNWWCVCSNLNPPEH